jgi:L-aminopeptidase/D-esterase-like protein
MPMPHHWMPLPSLRPPRGWRAGLGALLLPAVTACAQAPTRIGAVAVAEPAAAPLGAAANGTLTDVPGLAVGHHTLAERPTGCTVILARGGAVAGVDVRGAAPGTRETDLLRPENTVQQVHAIVLAGGSAFGLAAAQGTMQWLEAQGIGFDVGVAKVPIVPSAILFDLGVGDARVRPGADCGERAAAAASGTPVVEGDVGAGAGATVGKLAGMARAMKAGIGSASVRLADGTVVGALAAVNAVGDVIDPATGRVIAGVRTADGRALADARTLLRAGGTGFRIGDGRSTTLVVVATNVRLTKAQATKVAQMAHDGLARAISPVHTPADGDVVFALSTGTIAGEADVLTIGALAADAVAEAIVRAARTSRGLPGLPAAAQLAPAPR